MSRRYRILETRRFAADLKLLALSRIPAIGEKLHEYVYPQLASEPHWGPNIKRLRGWVPPTWRYRVGAWRFFYVIDEEARIVSLVAASHRKNAYRR